MRFNIATMTLAYASLASATINYVVQRAENPDADQSDAYGRIEAAMSAAASRYNRVTNNSLNKDIRVSYIPGVPTAEASFDGTLNFGSDRAYMTERAALHEISHTLGIGQTAAFDQRCADNNWPTGTPLVQSFDGPDTRINCGGGHIWPYGLNYDNEYSDLNAERHCMLIQAMVADGLQG